MIIYDEPSSRMADTENGDYLTSELRESEKREWGFTLCDERDRTLLCAVVTERHIDELGESRGARLISYVLTKAWIPTAQPDSPTYFDEDHPQIDRLAAFLKARRHKPPHSYFEFVDGRREADKSAQPETKSLPPRSYQLATVTQPLIKHHDQTPVTSPGSKNPLEKQSVLFGFLLAMALHFLFQILIAPLTLIHYFWFTQFVYVLPAIWYCDEHDEPGVKVGLIIGASLTFLLGLLSIMLTGLGAGSMR